MSDYAANLSKSIALLAALDEEERKRALRAITAAFGSGSTGAERSKRAREKKRDAERVATRVADDTEDVSSNVTNDVAENVSQDVSSCVSRCASRSPARSLSDFSDSISEERDSPSGSSPKLSSPEGGPDEVSAPVRGRSTVGPAPVTCISATEPLPDETREAARMLGLSTAKVEEEWRAFRAHHLVKQTLAPLPAFYALFVDSWCVKGKAYTARQPGGAKAGQKPVTSIEAKKHDEERKKREEAAVPPPPEFLALAANIGKGGA